VAILSGGSVRWARQAGVDGGKYDEDGLGERGELRNAGALRGKALAVGGRRLTQWVP